MPKSTRSKEKQRNTPVPENVIHCTPEVRGKIVRSLYVSAIDNFNIVNVAFTDGTALSVRFIPNVQLNVEYDDGSVPDGKVLKPVATDYFALGA